MPCNGAEGFAAVPRAFVPGDRSWYLVGVLAGQLRMKFLLDSGATHSLLPLEVWDQLDPRPKLNPIPAAKSCITGFAGDTTRAIGECSLTVSVPGRDLEVNFLIVDAACGCILGVDFMDDRDVRFDRESNMIWCRHTVVQPQVDEDVDCLQGVAMASGTHIVPPHAEYCMRIQVHGLPPGCTALVERAEQFSFTDLAVANTLTTLDDKGRGVVRIMNTGDTVVQVNSCEPIGMACAPESLQGPVPLIPGGAAATLVQGARERNWNEVVRRVVAEWGSSEEDDPELASEEEDLVKEWGGPVPPHLTKLFKEGAELLDSAQRSELAKLLRRFRNTFVKSSIEMGVTSVAEHKIVTGDAAPVKDRPRRIPLHKRPLIEKYVKDMLEVGVIQPSESPWAACPVLVNKPDGSVRWCVDWRGLNAVTVKDSYPMPRVDECLEAMEGASWFCSMDLQHGYWQIPLRKEDWQKTAFSTHMGLFEFTKTPMGVSNAPATFQRIMESVLNGLDVNIAVIYIDDIVVPGRSFQETLERLTMVLTRLEKAGLKLKTKKCHLFQDNIEFLGHRVCKDGIRAVAAKVKDIVDWAVPHDLKGLRGFLGMAGYYRRMIKNFATIAAPLNGLLKKGVRFEWTNKCQEAFQLLKDALVSDQVMAYPQKGGRYILDSDACDLGAGAVLSQVQGGVERVIAYWSKGWSPSQRNYSTTRKEMLACLLSMEAFRYYLLGLEDFTLRTDHACLRWLNNHKADEPMVNRWLQRFSAFNFSVVHRAGTKHGNADSLSRIPCKSCGLDRHEGKPCLPQEAAERKRVAVAVAAAAAESAMQKAKLRKRRRKANKASHLPIPDGNNFIWTPLIIAQHQKEDKFLSVVREWVAAGGNRPDWVDVSPHAAELKYWWTRYDGLRVSEEGCLQLIWRGRSGETKFKTIIPKSLQLVLLRQWHDSLQGGHLGANKTWGRARTSGYVWYDMRTTVRMYVRSCLVCAARRTGGERKQHELVQFPVGGRFELVGMDLVGPLPLSSRNNRYLLTITDYWTRWCDAIPIPNKESRTVAHAFMTRWVAQHGAPMSILTDQGKEFNSKLFADCCNLMDTWKMRTTPFHPR